MIQKLIEWLVTKFVNLVYLKNTIINSFKSDNYMTHVKLNNLLHVKDNYLVTEVIYTDTIKDIDRMVAKTTWSFNSTLLFIISNKKGGILIDKKDSFWTDVRFSFTYNNVQYNMLFCKRILLKRLSSHGIFYNKPLYVRINVVSKSYFKWDSTLGRYLIIGDLTKDIKRWSQLKLH